MSDILHIICDCKSPDHDIRFVKNPEEGKVYVEVQLIHSKSFLKRLIAGIKYIFGHTSRYGHWDCAVIDKKEGNKLYHFLKDYREI